jgi:hypothetical protein
MPSRIRHHLADSLRRKRRSLAASRSRLSLEFLEDRLVPSTFNVNSTADILNPPTGVITLRSAIQMANETPGSNTINLTVPGTYKITIPGAGEDNNATGDFDIIPNPASPAGSTLTIVNTSGEHVTIDGNHLDRIFDMNPADVTAPPGFTVILQNLILQNGVASPGDGAAGSGGAIRDQGNVSLTLTNVVIRNNRATADGGGVSMENVVSTPWTLTLNNSQILNNHAGDAGGGVETDGSGKIFIMATVISGNTSVNQGAGIWLDAIQVGTVFQSANLSLAGTVVSNNSALAADNFGGGIGNAGNGAVTLSNCAIVNNFSGGEGGGFADQNDQGTLTVQLSTFVNNTAFGNGGGIAEGGPVTTITASEIDFNSSGGNGGGVFANGLTLTVLQSTLAGNTAAGNGGGIELETMGAGAQGSTITDTTLTGNSALNNAGGNNGGGIDAPSTFIGDVLLLNDTINANFAANGGGIFWQGVTGSNFMVQNTILAQNTAATGPDAGNPAGIFTDLGGNLIGISGSGSGNTGFTAATTQTGTLANPLDPMLGPLQNNGGPTIGARSFSMVLQTEAPLPNSPAIGKGIATGAPATDERGFASFSNQQINAGAVSSATTAGALALPHGSALHSSLVIGTLSGLDPRAPGWSADDSWPPLPGGDSLTGQGRETVDQLFAIVDDQGTLAAEAPWSDFLDGLAHVEGPLTGPALSAG